MIYIFEHLSCTSQVMKPLLLLALSLSYLFLGCKKNTNEDSGPKGTSGLTLQATKKALDGTWTSKYQMYVGNPDAIGTLTWKFNVLNDNTWDISVPVTVGRGYTRSRIDLKIKDNTTYIYAKDDTIPLYRINSIDNTTMNTTYVGLTYFVTPTPQPTTDAPPVVWTKSN